MPTYIRWREEGATYFFTVVTYRRQRILTKPQSRQLLRESISQVQAKLPFDVLAFVLLPDHMHCIWTLPPEDDNFPERWRLIKGRFSYLYLKRGGHDWKVSDQHQKQGRGGVWQPRYWEHRIRDEADYYRHRDYIHFNPIKHGHVENPGEWVWSSFHRHVKMGWLDPNWPGSTPIA